MRRITRVFTVALALCMLFGVSSVSLAEGASELDTLRVGVAALPSSMDPTLNVGNTSIRIHYNCFETLLTADPGDGTLSGMLAESWERVDDYTIEFHLRKGVLFHNGTEMTAKDVQFSFDRLKQEIQGNNLAKSLMSTIDHVDILDDYTCRVVTADPDPLLEQRLASSWGAWILPKDYIEEAGDAEFALNAIGTGPFKIISYSPEKVVLQRFDEYWGAAPSIANIEYILYTENSTRITALVTGEVDIITQLPMDQISIVESTPGLRVESTSITNMHLVQFYIDGDPTNPINDKKLRQALSYAIDRQLLSDAFWGGKAIVPNGHQYFEFGSLYFADYPAEPYDVEKAKELLAESEYDGELITYELRSGYYTYGNEAAEAIVDMWKSIGVNAQVIYKDSNDEETIVRNWSNTMRFPDPAGGLWLLWGGAEPTEDWQSMPQAFIDAGKVLTTSMDPEERAAAARTLMDIFREEVPGTLLYYPVENWGVRDDLDWHPYSNQTMDFRAENFSLK